jgi:Na+/proline symporter
VEGIGPTLAQAIVSARPGLDPEQILEETLKAGIPFLTPADPDYPPLLWEVPDPPPILYALGECPNWQQPAIAIVGTRAPTAYGRQWTQKVSAALAEAGCVVVSGLATGIDGIAHQACLDAGGKTVAVVGTGVAFVAVAFSLGREAGSELDPWLSLPGPQGRWSWQGLFGNQLLFFMATPLFPQFFQRFYMAKSARPFQTLMVVWPLLILLVFFPAALLGVWGRLAFPSLEKTDQIMPMMLQTLPSGVAAVVITAALAALMSTADSQLLTASSLVTRDLVVTFFRRQLSPHQEELLGRWVVLGIGLASFVIALNPPGLIVEIATWSFQGNAMLFPVLIAGLYWKRATRAGAVAGALVSSGLTLGWLSGLLPRAWTGGWLPVIPAVVIGSGVLIGVSLLTQPPKEQVTAYYEEGPWGE